MNKEIFDLVAEIMRAAVEINMLVKIKDCQDVDISYIRITIKESSFLIQNNSYEFEYDLYHPQFLENARKLRFYLKEDIYKLEMCPNKKPVQGFLCEIII